jgi:hypothetical protein
VSRKAILLLALLGGAGIVRAEPEGTVVVLSSESGPYAEALAGFRESFVRPFSTSVLSKGALEIPKATRLIVAIGGKAALHRYDIRNVLFVYCVAPGVYVDPAQHSGPGGKVYVSPAPRLLLQKLLEFQPGLRRLGALWVGESVDSYGLALKQQAAAQGVQVRADHMASIDELPDKLRALKGHIDALWLPPDPLLITPQSFSVMRQFALDNSIPLYVSIDGLADKGAAASVSVSFREMGRKAGALASQLLSGTIDPSGAAYGDHVLVTINAESARQSGLSISGDVLRKADRVIP